MNILQHKQEISYIKSLEFMEGFKTAYEQQGYDVLLTLTFVDGRSITKELADHKLDIFLRQLDRLYFGKIKGKQKTKIEREVFRETKDDQGRRFIHFHILLKSIGNKELFRHNLQASVSYTHLTLPTKA